MAIPEQVRRTIDRLLSQLTADERSGATPPGFTFEAADDGAIRDGEYGDPTQHPRPAWMKEQEVGWEPLTK
jgi:hypothetical protein